MDNNKKSNEQIDSEMNKKILGELAKGKGLDIDSVSTEQLHQLAHEFLSKRFGVQNHSPKIAEDFVINKVILKEPNFSDNLQKIRDNSLSQNTELDNKPKKN